MVILRGFRERFEWHGDCKSGGKKSSLNLQKNTPLEVFVAVCERMGIETGVDLFKAMDIAEDLIVPLMDHMVRVDRDALTLGYAGVYSSFLLFAKRSAEKYHLSSRDILVELGRRRTVGGQEDMIEDLALDMARERGTI